MLKSKKDKTIATRALYYFCSQIKSWLGLHLPTLIKFISNNRIYFVEGKRYQELKNGNSQLRRRRANSDCENIVNQTKIYSQEMGIDIN